MRKNLYNMTDGLVMILSLGNTHIANLKWGYYRLRSKLQFRFRKRNWIVPGLYRNRMGQFVRVCHNTTRWFDKLPFVIINMRGDNIYTVDEDGLCWPQSGYASGYDLVELID